jgi:hypothetical protein
MSLRTRSEWHFFAALYRAAPGATCWWWTLLVLRGVLPALLGIISGGLIAAISAGESLWLPLTLIGSAFVALQVLTPVHQALSTNLGRRTAAYFYDQLMRGTPQRSRADAMGSCRRAWSAAFASSMCHFAIRGRARSYCQMSISSCRPGWWWP